MDRLRWMQTFVRVVESGSFSAVARELNTTQSAVSKHVGALENSLGVPLLIRSSRRVTPSEAGARYYQRCLQVLDLVAEADQDARASERCVTGLLRVAAPVVFGRLHIVPNLPEFYAQNPKLQIDLRLNDQFINLVEEGVDVAYRVGELSDSQLIARRIGTTHRATLATPAYLAAFGEPEHPRDLARHNCLIYTGLARLNEWSFGGPEGEIRVSVQGRFQTNSSEAIREAVLADLGIAFSPVWMFGSEIRSGRVVPLLQAFQPLPLPIHVVFPPARRPALKTKRFVDFMTARFDTDPFISRLK